MTKYIEVAFWYVQQHPAMFTALGLCILAICLMVHEAKRTEDEYVTRYPEEE